MGHSEYLLAVAGLSKDDIDDRTRKLSSGDWSSFPKEEQIAFAFARKQSKSPAEITDDDFQQLTNNFGPHRAVDIVWWSSRCHFMTRVADAFQLPLEATNIFVPKRRDRDSTNE